MQHALGHRLVEGFHDGAQLGTRDFHIFAADGFAELADSMADMGAHDLVAGGTLDALTVSLDGRLVTLGQEGSSVVWSEVGSMRAQAGQSQPRAWS